jgi:polysaccharide biosynthesis/export protein
MKLPQIDRMAKLRLAIASVALSMAVVPVFIGVAFGQATRVQPQYQQNPPQGGQPGQPAQAGQSIPGQNPAQNPNAQLPAPPAAPRGGDLVLGPGDVLQIQVADEQDLDGKYLVSDSGEITVPTVPQPIHATGLNTTQLAAAIGKGLKEAKILQQPVVSVYVEEYHSHTVTVVGAVVRPGLYPIETHTTVLDVISEAGGLLPNAGNAVTVAKAGSPTAESLTATKPQASPPGQANAATMQNASLEKSTPVLTSRDTIKLDFSKLTTGKDPSLNIEVKAGDVVSVGTAPVIYIVGAVMKPGAFAVQNDRSQITVLQALALVEGMTPVASPGHAVIVRNSGEVKERKEIPIDISKVQKGKGNDQYLEANDILFIPESGMKKTLGGIGRAAVSAASGVGYSITRF